MLRPRTSLRYCYFYNSEPSSLLTQHLLTGMLFLSALSHVGSHPAVRIEISTVPEVLARLRKPPTNSVVQEFAASDNTIPVYRELKLYLAARAGSGTSSERVDQMVREFAARVVGQSRRALGHARIAQ